jgi:hypothetical protein
MEIMEKGRKRVQLYRKNTQGGNMEMILPMLMKVLPVITQ